MLRAVQRRPPCVGHRLTVPGPMFHPHLPFPARPIATCLGRRPTAFRIEPFQTLNPSFRRSFTLSSLFSPRTKPTPTPSPSTIADISLLEAAANINHNDVDKQITLYEALLATRVKAGYDTVISRWERLSEFVCCVWLYLTTKILSAGNRIHPRRSYDPIKPSSYTCPPW